MDDSTSIDSHSYDRESTFWVVRLDTSSNFLKFSSGNIENWLNKFEKFCLCFEVDNNNKVEEVSFFLEGKAERWDKHNSEFTC